MAVMEVRQTMLMLSGLPGSGKSRIAQGWLLDEGDNPRARINYDDLRIELLGPDFKYNRKDEEIVKKTATLRAEKLIESGYDLVIDNCNLFEGARARWEAMAKRYAMDLIRQDVDTPLNVCIAQDKRREGRARVGRAVIERMALFSGHIDWNDKIRYNRDFIIVDLDGTVADNTARRKRAFGSTVHGTVEVPDVANGNVRVKCPLDGIVMDRKCPECGGKMEFSRWDLFYQGVENDKPIQPIIDLVSLLSQKYDVLFVSGRPTDEAGLGTEQFIDENIKIGYPFRHLFMRGAMDQRPDFVIKKEILDLLPKDRIKYCLDDRDQVVEMWRAEGLTCLQVAEGLF
jgi:predicted kinase